MAATGTPPPTTSLTTPTTANIAEASQPSGNLLAVLMQEFMQKYPDKDVKIESFQLRVETPDQYFEIGNDVYILLSSILDIPYYSRLKIHASDNLLITSKADFQQHVQNTTQVFQNNIHTVLENYGATSAAFVPFNLVFAKMTFVDKVLQTDSDKLTVQLEQGKEYYQNTSF